MEFKPTPYTKQQFLSKLVIPKDPTYGNPNQIETELKPGEPELNRAYQTSLKGDTSKTISIGLQDIDEAVFYYFNNIIKPIVVQNGNQIPVPVAYASAERWVSVQKDGYFRDKNGKAMHPYIIIRRTGFEKNRNLTNKLDGNGVNNFAVARGRYNYKNQYTNFDILNDYV